LDLTIPAHAHQLGQTKGVVAIGLVDLAGQRCLGVTGIEARHREPELPEFVPMPDRERPRLEADLRHLRGPRANERRDRRGLTRDFRFDQHGTFLIDHAHACLFIRHIKTDILRHGWSPSPRSPRGHLTPIVGEQPPARLRYVCVRRAIVQSSCCDPAPAAADG
jgi:hypothetical protein